MKKKMVLIGAGSAMFTQGMVSDLIRDSKRQEWELALVDIDEKALETAKKLSEKMIRHKNTDIKLEYSPHRRDVLPGADYVVTVIGVGGRRAWEQDVFIPRKYGVYQPVGDSVMPGGISRAMRMVPAMVDIARDVMELCPNAVFINYSNPMTAICRSVRKATGYPIIGLCHGSFQTEKFLGDFCGFDEDKVSSYAAGLNHLTFFYDFRIDGKDAWPFMKEKLAALRQQENPVKDALSWELFDTYQAFPAPGDRHVTEFYAERFPHGNYFGKTLGVDVFSFENTIEQGDKIYAEMEQLAHSPDPLTEDYLQKFEGEHEQLMDIIYSMEHDHRKVFYANIPNNGTIPALPKDAVLEMPAAATAKGLLPLLPGGFPDKLTEILAKHISIAEVTAEAALKGDKKLFAEAILMGGYMLDRTAVEKMVDEMLLAQKRYLPQFN